MEQQGWEASRGRQHPAEESAMWTAKQRARISVMSKGTKAQVLTPKDLGCHGEEGLYSIGKDGRGPNQLGGQFRNVTEGIKKPSTSHCD